MAVRTWVSMSVRRDRLDEARLLLGSLDPGPLGPVEIYTPDAPDALRAVSVSLPGDVREAVEQHLRGRTDLEFQTELRDVDAE
ncbi:hypothetical protein [Streptomyces sp. NPDC046909]|uniref:hypothetical protein n=1 Tax=Streptomyces sp. NPDC046909 TaxID=3155617 RepID=UPI0033D49DA0